MTSEKLTMKQALLLAAPHTWAASTIPVLFSWALSVSKTGRFDAVMGLCTMVISVLMQSSVNALNDYSDFMKGTDTVENSPDPQDAVLVYGGSPKMALGLGICFLAAAAVIGVYVIAMVGVVPLFIGLVGALAILLYSFGKTPISYLPVGELVSGFVMGGLIPLGGYYLQTGELSFSVLLYSLPLIIGIGMIMYTNNSCDIERDTTAQRMTLPRLIGAQRAQELYRVLLISWVILPELILIAAQMRGMYFYPLGLLVLLSQFTMQLRLRLGQETRGVAMQGVLFLNIALGLLFMTAVMI